MRLSVHAAQLKNVLSRIHSIVDKRTSRPILSNIHLVAKDNQLQLAATDLEVASKIFIPSKVEKEGAFCVNAKNISDILREFPDKELKIELLEDDNILRISQNRIDFSLVGFKNFEFPHLVFSDEQSSFFSLTASQFLDIIGKTSHAISVDETRPYLNGIFLQQIESKLRSVATDGYRLAILDIDEFSFDTQEILASGIIIPKKGVFELKKMAEQYEPEKPINISIDESFIYINVDNSDYLSIRLIAREYPKYQTIIPSKVTYTINADRILLLNAIKRIKIMANEKTNGISIKFCNNEMQITANHPSLGKAFEMIPVDYDDKELEFRLNAKYFIDILSTFNSTDIFLEIKNEFGPMLVKSYCSQNFLGLIMPFRL